MDNIGQILNSVATLLVSIGAAVVLFKTAGLISSLTDRIAERKE